MSRALTELLQRKRVVVCCGAGGVGKTSVAAALGLLAARQGRNVLVITIDPSRRLAQVLHVDRNTPRPVMLSETALASGGVVTREGSLSAWMLDPSAIADSVVHKVEPRQHIAEQYFRNGMYRHVTAMIAGMQEYTAVEALYQFITEDRYDLIVLDTPPSRNALQFLDAPTKIGNFLDARVFQLFVPGNAGPLRRAAQRVLERIMDAALGEQARKELQLFFALFGDILAKTKRDAADIQKFFSSPDISFLLVTSPLQEAVTEAFYFESKTNAVLGVDAAGYILNRSFAAGHSRSKAPETVMTGLMPPEGKSALKKLAEFAAAEAVRAEADKNLFESLKRRGGPGKIVISLPMLGAGVDDMVTLASLTNSLIDEDDDDDD